MQKSADKMLEVNLKQKEYYEISEGELYNTEKQNIATRLWTILRNSFNGFRSESNIESDVIEKHWEWIGGISSAKILDLGCHTGNPLSLDLAQKSKEYIGIDLSSSAIKILQEKIDALETQNAKTFSLDFLSTDFQEEHKNSIDIIYAKAVAHHFKEFDLFLEKCDYVLKDGGKVITFDPADTYLPMTILRAAYRPFQSDKDWEWPFTKQTYKEIEKVFKITDIIGILGRSKYAFPVYFLNKNLGMKLAKRFHSYDKLHSKDNGKALWSCMQVAMCWQKVP